MRDAMIAATRINQFVMDRRARVPYAGEEIDISEIQVSRLYACAMALGVFMGAKTVQKYGGGDYVLNAFTDVIDLGVSAFAHWSQLEEFEAHILEVMSPLTDAQAEAYDIEAEYLAFIA